MWVTSPQVRASRHLGVLFLYSFPSEFLVGLVPHEPVLIDFGAFHPAWVVAAVAGIGTVLAEALNYSLLRHVQDRSVLGAARRRPGVRRVMDLFSRRPFAAVVVAGFTPVPFFPIRFLVVMTAYPRWKYLAGVALSRMPRFGLLAAFGAWFTIPSGALVALMVVMLLTVNVPALARLVRDGGLGEVSHPAGR